MEMRQGARSARSEAREAAAAAYTSLGCARGGAFVGKGSALLSLQPKSSVLESAEEEPQVAKRRTPQPPRCTCAPAPGLSEDALRACRVLSEKVRRLLQGEKEWFYIVSL